MFKYISLAGVLISILMCSCRKTEGPQGPPGNANVRSVTFNVDSTIWKYEPGRAYLDRVTPEINKDIYDRGSVMVYWHVDNHWVALPFSYPSGATQQTMGYTHKEGNIRIFVTQSDGATPAKLNTATFKSVVTAAY